MSLIWVALGGAIGAVARYLAAGLVHRIAPPTFPWGTLAVNVSGSLAFGAMAGLLEQGAPAGSHARLFVLIGLIGAFTTFSTFTFETFMLVRDGESLSAGLNVAGQVVVSFLALWGGFMLARLR